MKKTIVSSSIAFLVVLMATFGVMAYQNSTTPSTNTETTSATKAIESAEATSDSSLKSDVTISDTITITEGGEHVIEGTITDGQVIVSAGDEDVTLILNGVDITNANGAAIYIEEAGDVTIELASGSTNILKQTGLDTDEEQKAALYSSSDLEIIGDTSGTLFVQSTVADGISSSDDIVFTSGNITVESADDGIRGKDSVTIYGGTIVVDAEDDGVKSTNTEELGRGVLTITGGSVIVTSGDDAIKAEQEIHITGGTLHIIDSVEGIEAPVIVIDDGEITLYASDDGINAAASDIITTGLSITINGGDITVEVGSGDTDGLDSNGTITVTGGVLKVTNPSIGSGPATAFDANGTTSFTGGTIYINGEEVDEIPTEQMGGGGMRGGRGGMTPPQW